MKKIKILSVVMAIMLIMSTPFFASAKSFDDVSSETHSWAIDAIENMAEIGVITGYGDGTFKPDNVVSKLESLLLTARILGVDAPENEALLESAINLYGDVVASYNLSFGSDEVCYLLMKNILSENELVDYIGKTNVSAGMKRYEIAILLTKALDAEDEVSKNLITSLEFADADEIPAYAKKYVEYVFTNNLMNGVGDNKFSPNTDVTRAQIAVLMDKLSTITKYSFVSGKVTEIDYSTKVMKIKNGEETLRYILNDDVKLRYEGADILVKGINIGYDAYITLKEDTVYAIDFVAPLVEKEVSGILSSKTTGATNSVSFYVIEDDAVSVTTDVKESYPLVESATITYEGKKVALNELEAGAFVKVSIKEGKIVSINGFPKSHTVSGIVSEVEITPLCKLNIQLSDGDMVSYLVGNDIEVTRNGKKASAQDVVAGDTINATVVYDRISKIVSTSKTIQKNGVIKEVIISATPRITVKTDEGEITYPVTNSCALEIAGKSLPTFYDLRVADTVTLTLEGETVVKIMTNSTDGVTQVNGVVTSVNTSYSVIQVNYVDASSGMSITEPVFVKSKTTIIDILTGSTIKLSGVKEGAKITAFGTRNGGIFEATTINISNN